MTTPGDHASTRAPALLIVATTSLTLRSFLLPHVEHFRRRGWRVDGAAAGATGCEPCCGAFDRVFEIDWSRNPLDPRNVLRARAAVSRIVDFGDYDIVHVHTPIAGFVTRWALRDLGRRPAVVYTAHGFHFHPEGGRVRNWVFRTLERLGGRWTDRLVVINRKDERAVADHSLVRPGRLRYIPGVGVDLALLDPARVPAEAIGELRHELGIGSAPLVVMVAEFNPGKRHDVAIRALDAMRHQEAHIAFAGVGPALEAMRQLAGHLGLTQRVHFLGYRADVMRVLRAATVSLLPSAREGLPRSIMEAMALEVPVVATRIRGIEELLAGGGGVLVPLGDVDATAEALDRLLDDPVAAAAMGRLGRESLRPFSMEVVLAAHETMYQELLDERR